MIAVGTRYKAAQAMRLQATRDEHTAKEEMQSLIAKEGMKRLADGTIHFTLEDGKYEVQLIPQDDKLKFKEVKSG